MTSAKLATSILLLSLAAAIGLRLAGVKGKTIMATDESPSYLNAAGKGCEYYDLVLAEKKPIGAWAPSSEWKKFLRIDQPFAFGEIAHALSRFDIHPPLYFWLLHLWALIIGLHEWTGPSLNIIISVVALLSLWGLARRVLGNSLEATVVAFTWALSPAVFQMSFEARHYDLLALVAILFVVQLLKVIHSKTAPPKRDYVLLTLLTAAGALTHYYFSILVAGCGLFAAAKLFKPDQRRFLIGIGAVLAGYAIFYLLHPNFYNSFQNEQKEVGIFSAADFSARLENVVNTFKQFFALPIASRYLLLGIAAAWLIAAGRTKRWLPFTAIPNRRGFEMLYFFAWPAAIQIGLYLAYFSPQHAALPKHFSAAWPFLAFLPVLILRASKKFQTPLTILFWLFFIFAAIRGLQNFNAFAASQPDPTAVVQRAPAVILDNASMNVLPRIVAKLPDRTPVFAASRETLQKTPAAWLERCDSNTVYISVNAPIFSNNTAGQEAIVALIRQNHAVEFIKNGAWGFGDLVVIKRKLL